MRRCCQTFVALLALALQAIDAIVGARGHSHSHYDSACVTLGESDHHGSACSHHDHEAPPPESENDEHDDCSICRHFSQPTAPVALTIELVGCERVEPFVAVLLTAVLAAAPSTHLARGPPASCA